MFDKDGFIADYIEAVRTNNTEAKQNVLLRLTEDEDFDFRKELVSGIVTGLKEQEGEYTSEIEFLNNQLQLLEAAKVHEQKKQDSTAEEAKDNTEASEATPDVAADDSADKTEGERTEADAGAETETEVESGGYAPTTEEETEKTEEPKS